MENMLQDERRLAPAMPTMLIATWALRRYDWLALRLIITVATIACMLIVSQITVYVRI